MILVFASPCNVRVLKQQRCPPKFQREPWECSQVKAGLESVQGTADGTMWGSSESEAAVAMEML